MSAVLFAPEFTQRTAASAAAVPGPRCAVVPVAPVFPVLPVLPVLGQVDAACASLVQAAREAGVQPVLCASPGQALARAQAAGTPLVLVQAATMQVTPGAVMPALRAGGPLRLVLSGPAFGSLAHARALEGGFDKVWPLDLPAPLLSMMLHKALGSSRPVAAQQRALPPAEAPATGLQVDPAYGICHWRGRMAPLTRGSALLLQTLQTLQRAHPHNGARIALATALDGPPNTEPRAAGEVTVLGRRVDTQVSRLRQELAKAGFQALRIYSARFIGYRLELPR